MAITMVIETSSPSKVSRKRSDGPIMYNKALVQTKENTICIAIVFLLTLQAIITPNTVAASSPGQKGGWFGSLLSGKNAGNDERPESRQLQGIEQKQDQRPPNTNLIANTNQQHWLRQQGGGLGGQNQGNTNIPPPPFPPPPSLIPKERNSVGGNYDNGFNETKEPPSTIGSTVDDNGQWSPQNENVWGKSPPLPIPPPPPQESYGNVVNNPPQPPPPPPGFDDWHMQQVSGHQQHEPYQQYEQQTWGEGQHQFSNNNNNGEKETIKYLESELHTAQTNQNLLYSEISNLTTTIAENDKKADAQLAQIDELIEKLADAESHASAESNAALEYKANCTSLGDAIKSLRDQIDEWEQKCHKLEEKEKCDETKIADFKRKLKEREFELEEVYCGIEKARAETEREEYLEHIQKRRKEKKSGGVFTWMFVWMFGNDDDDFEHAQSLEKLQELAKSNLLTALQTERNNVDELEAMLAAVQQNNSAISEMVSSRDSLINELNDRVAVFEEDKVVLKAALRQLQKEMKEEGPKTQKLATDLKSTQDEFQKLQLKIKELKAAHEKEIDMLNVELDQRDEMINETDSRMSMISGYVDQLEERLASFAIARRQINDREEQCKDIEEKIVLRENDLSAFRNQVQELTGERDELKKLAELLVEERSALQKEKKKLQQEVGSLVVNSTSLQEQIDVLSNKIVSYERDAVELQYKLNEATMRNANHEVKLAEMQAASNLSVEKIANQEETIRKSLVLTSSLEDKLQNLQEESQKLKADKEEVTKLISVMEAEIVSKRNALSKAKENEAKVITQLEEKQKESIEANDRELKANLEIQSIRSDFLETKEREARAVVEIESISEDLLKARENVARANAEIETLSKDLQGARFREENVVAELEDKTVALLEAKESEARAIASLESYTKQNVCVPQDGVCDDDYDEACGNSQLEDRASQVSDFDPIIDESQKENKNDEEEKDIIPLPLPFPPSDTVDDEIFLQRDGDVSAFDSVPDECEPASETENEDLDYMIPSPPLPPPLDSRYKKEYGFSSETNDDEMLDSDSDSITFERAVESNVSQNHDEIILPPPPPPPLDNFELERANGKYSYDRNDNIQLNLQMEDDTDTLPPPPVDDSISANIEYHGEHQESSSQLDIDEAPQYEPSSDCDGQIIDLDEEEMIVKVEDHRDNFVDSDDAYVFAAEDGPIPSFAETNQDIAHENPDSVSEGDDNYPLELDETHGQRESKEEGEDMSHNEQSLDNSKKILSDEAKQASDEPELPIPESLENLTVTKMQEKKPVLFRSVRKAFARTTGMHGFFSPSSKRKGRQ